MSNNFVVYDMPLTQIILAYNLRSLSGNQTDNSFYLYNLLTVNGVNALSVNPDAFGIPVTY
jgi:hypothetical protein